MALIENEASVEHESGAKNDTNGAVNRVRGNRRLAKLDNFIENLQSVKDLYDNVASGEKQQRSRRHPGWGQVRQNREQVNWLCF